MAGAQNIRTRANSDAATIILDQTKAAAACSGKTLTKEIVDAPAFPSVIVESINKRDERRGKNHTANSDELVTRRFKYAPAGRQPSQKDKIGVVAYATDLITVGWVFVVKRSKAGKNWLAPDTTAKQKWRQAPDWNDVLLMLGRPSTYELYQKGRCANKAWGGAMDALLRVFKRKPPTEIPAFWPEQKEGYMKFYFESLGPEELVLVSFHD